MHFRRFLLVALSFCFVFPVFAKDRLVIAGTGDSQTILRMLAQEYNQSQADVEVVIPDSIGSGGGVRGLAKGRFPLARTARPVKEKEQTGNLKEHLFALSPVVFVSSSALNESGSLQSQQVLDIYSGKINQWDEIGGQSEPIYAVDREPGDSSRSVIEKNLAGFKELNSVAKVFFSTPEATAAIAQHDNTLGYLPMSIALVQGLNIFAIDGVTPDAQSVNAGTYPFVTRFYLVSDGEPVGNAKRFIDYLKSPEAIAILNENGLIPAGITE
jgi:phosphate transport system substrate-binding protein